MKNLFIFFMMFLIYGTPSLGKEANPLMEAIVNTSKLFMNQMILERLKMKKNSVYTKRLKLTKHFCLLYKSIQFMGKRKQQKYSQIIR